MGLQWFLALPSCSPDDQRDSTSLLIEPNTCSFLFVLVCTGLPVGLLRPMAWSFVLSWALKKLLLQLDGWLAKAMVRLWFVCRLC